MLSRQCQRPGGDLIALGAVADQMQYLQIPLILDDHPGRLRDDVVKVYVGQIGRQLLIAPRADPALGEGELPVQLRALAGPVAPTVGPLVLAATQQSHGGKFGTARLGISAWPVKALAMPADGLTDAFRVGGALSPVEFPLACSGFLAHTVNAFGRAATHVTGLRSTDARRWTPSRVNAAPALFRALTGTFAYAAGAARHLTADLARLVLGVTLASQSAHPGRAAAYPGADPWHWRCRFPAALTGAKRCRLDSRPLNGTLSSADFVDSVLVLGPACDGSLTYAVLAGGRLAADIATGHLYDR